MSVAYLGLGSNIGEPAANLEAAVAALDVMAGIAVLRRSRWYGSKAVGYTEQPDFVNGVVEIATDFTPSELLAAVKGIEAGLGRTPSFRWGPRLIDLDILDYSDAAGQRIVRGDRPIIPHPSMHERRFVLEPLAELAPTWQLPDGRSIAELLAGVQEQELWPLG